MKLFANQSFLKYNGGRIKKWLYSINKNRNKVTK